MQGLDPRMTEIAMEQMRRMSPEQLQNLTRSMGNMNPAFMQQAMEQMKNMNSSDWDRAKSQMNSMPPEELTKHATEAATHLNSQQQYIFNTSVQLKNDGNKLHSAGKYSEAIEKYERAKNNLADFSTAESKDLRKACVLNLSSCYLNLERYDDCIVECDSVLQVEPDSLKALYRRGQAFTGKKLYTKAVKDLRKAVRYSGHDPVQQGIIKEKLSAAEEKLEESGVYVAPSGSSKTGPAVSSVIIEEVVDEEEAPTPAPAAHAPPSSSPAPSASSTSRAPVPPTLDPAMRKQAAEMMKNPDMMKQVSSMMNNMSDEQLAQMSKQMGMSVSPEMMKAAQQQMQHMDPQQIQSMMSAVENGGFPMPGGVPMSSIPAQSPEAIKKATEMMQQNPGMVKMAAEMMSKMSPEQINDVCSKAGGQLHVTPEMAKHAAEQFSKMTPEEVANTARMAAEMQAGTGTNTSNSADTARPASTTATSTTVQTSAPTASTSAPAAGPSAQDFAGMAKAMADMDPEQLTAMSQMAGGVPGGMSPDMAKVAAEMMSKMSPEDMERMSRMAMSMGMPGAGMPGMPPIGSPADMSHADMAKMAAQMDPAMMETAASMMRGMDDESLASMMMSSGMCSTREQAEVMAKQMKGMSDSQMKMMMKAASTIHTVVAKATTAKDFLMQRKLLVLSIVVVLIALLLSTLGYI